AKLILDKPLQPHDTIVISTNFFVKIPDARFSRLGHSGEAYFMTQWYPKPAVYDNEGWHAMPYLDQGEFYSEFGSFDVRITLPDNYVLAATGDRIDAEKEEDFLNRRVKQTIEAIEKNTRIKDGMAFPPSSAKLKTIRFKQYRVHDFAWFADKRFYALHDQIQLPESKRTVDTWVFFTDKNFNLWKNALNYVNAATDFYSSLLGDYPYNHVTAVDGTIMAGGGMEYPEITVIGDMGNAFDLNVTIAHEVGHNWFYGILGSDERHYPFMDEGINSFYEMRYIQKYYPNAKLTQFIGRDSTFKLFHLNKVPIWKEKEFMYYLSHLSNVDQAINLHSEAYSAFNYGSIVYGKTPLVFDYLMAYMTPPNFDRAMQAYYQKFKFKHPQPQDLYDVLAEGGQFNLEWLNTHLISATDPFDYKIKKVRGNAAQGYAINIKNKTGLIIPFNISGYKDGRLVGDVWFDGFTKKRTLNFPPGEVDCFKIDGDEKLIENNRRNNYSRSKGLFRKAKPFQFSLLSTYPDASKNQINYLPIVGSNIYDGLEVGLALHNIGFFRKKVEYVLAPYFGTASKQLLGFGELTYNIFPKKIFRQISIGSKVKSFNYDRYRPKAAGINAADQLFKYYKVDNFVQFDFKHLATSKLNSMLRVSNTNVLLETADNKFTLSAAGVETYTLSKKNEFRMVNQLHYELKNKRLFDPYHFTADLQQANSVSKISLQLNYRYNVSDKKQMEINCFFGTFLSGSLMSRGLYAFRPSGYNGYDDYLFNYNYLGRNESTGLAFSQFTEKDGNLKVWTPLGRSSTWMASIQLKSPKIGKLPLKVYADIMACDGQFLLKEKMLWDAGINIPLIQQVVDIYIPLFYSKDIQNTLLLNNVGFFNRIRFTFNIHKLDPKNFIASNFF
ncbi:MAG: M1 family metallopeptidase, partial [Bacteroidota bacterium]